MSCEKLQAPPDMCFGKAFIYYDYNKAKKQMDHSQISSSKDEVILRCGSAVFGRQHNQEKQLHLSPGKGDPGEGEQEVWFPSVFTQISRLLLRIKWDTERDRWMIEDLSAKDGKGKRMTLNGKDLGRDLRPCEGCLYTIEATRNFLDICDGAVRMVILLAPRGKDQ
uniref:Uncharacterized protein n=1 Tax=Chromera velia CCMP2878 TaxID=1169474 RepID=A0A0G4I6R8_9ALVE|mmetsp:Transcript_20582/g.41135  ORF Transcript_20582/g.41135 Transcript_20582/m.41135 type:complete len:166 (-) Transcript_20582:208-705(-)|eukprot:Cvel_11450.t1-p1 / transcript=Cvel_11450.t1 / gene=Cvel_11450 / organism=Chromera_velia_CCMP2878 / gene_product=hypothetical protein / transcript_product=hypothetical protein / location=Cvel_scaffold720:42118-42612(+) / protein_length=165 / sequence_SO=supercontig / SO=protein_coding / is_pseudo=false